MVIVGKRPLSLICSMTGGLLQCQRLLFGRSCVRHLGVTSRLLQKNFYEVLGLDNDASSSDIKNAYYQLSKKYHPDVCDDQESIQKFHEVSQAYDVLGDPRKRRNYDKGSVVYGANREDDERVKYRYEGEDFMKNRTGLKDTYSGVGAHCSIRSRRTSDRNRSMDNLMMGARRDSFDSEQANIRHRNFLDDKHNLKERRAANQRATRTSSAGSTASPPKSDGGGYSAGGGGGGGGGGGSPLKLVALLAILFAIMKMVNG